MKLKKYKNRKLYNVQTKSYITLEEIYKHLEFNFLDKFEVLGPNQENLSSQILLDVLKFNKKIPDEKLRELIRYK